MAEYNEEHFSLESFDPELNGKIAELASERDSWRIHAQLSENHLNRILQSPAWKITKPFRILNLIAWKIKPSLKNEELKSWQPKKSGQTVYEKVRDLLTIEERNANHSAERIALFAQWSRSEEISQSTQRLMQHLLDSNYEVILISACESPAPLKINDSLAQRITVVRKPNLGYDFGSWSTAIQLFPEVMNAEHVIIVNDSLIGPFDNSFSEIVKRLEDSQFDLTGISDSIQMRHHIQSYMVHFNKKAFSHQALQKFWKEVYEQDEKMDVVEAYELGLTATAQANNLFVGALFPWNLVGQYWHNPSVDRWKRLLDLGFPFVKREVTRESSKSNRGRILDLLVKKFGIDQEFQNEIHNSASV